MPLQRGGHPGIMSMADPPPGPIEHYALWENTDVPAVSDSGDTAAVAVGIKFSVAYDLRTETVKFYKDAANTGVHRVTIWDDAGTDLWSVDADLGAASGWQTVELAQFVPLEAGRFYIASVHCPVGRYSTSAAYFTATPRKVAPVFGHAGVLGYGDNTTRPATESTANHWVTPVVEFQGIYTDPPTRRVPESGIRYRRAQDNSFRALEPASQAAADKSISALPAATSIGAADLIEMVQGGDSYVMTVATLKGLLYS